MAPEEIVEARILEENMPPKVKVTKNEILKTALELLRQEGEGVINARNISQKVGCSTQPIYVQFATMEELKEALREVAYEAYLCSIEKEVASGKYPAYKAYGMAYMRFAMEEKELFKFLFMCDREGMEMNVTPDFTASVEMIMEANGISRERAEKMHFEMWSFVHGIGTMLATSFLPLDWDSISQMTTDVYHGLQSVHSSQENKR